jgi:hypothetical protein
LITVNDRQRCRNSYSWTTDCLIRRFRPTLRLHAVEVSSP